MQSSSLTFLSALKQHCATSEFPLRDIILPTWYSSAVMGHVSLAFRTFIFAFSFQILIFMYFGMHFFGFILFGICSIS